MRAFPLAHESLRECAVVNGTRAPLRVIEDRLPEARRFCKFDVAANRGTQHFRVRPRQSASDRLLEELIEFRNDLFAVRRLRLMHAQHNAANFEGRIQALRNEFHCLKQFRQSLHRKEVRLHRHDDFASEAQRVERQQSKARWTINEHEVVLITHFVKSALQEKVAIRGIRELHLRSSEIHRRRKDVEIRAHLHDRIFDARIRIKEEVVYRLPDARTIHAKVQREMRLRIEIDEQHSATERCNRGADVYGGGGLADTAFLIDKRGDSRRYFRHSWSLTNTHASSGMLVRLSATPSNQP